MSYAPLPGTAPARAIAYLQTLPPGKEVSTAELAEAIDYDKGSMASTMTLAKYHGLVVGRRPKGVLYTMWSSGTGVPLAGPADADDEPLGYAQLAPQDPAAVRISVFDTGRIAAAPTPRPVRFALWSDGALQIERDGQDNVLLPPEETKAMFAYLDRMREHEVAA